MITADFSIAVHPGEVLDDILESSGITQTALAEHLHIAQSKISDICRARRGVSAEMACKLGRAFRQSPAFWMNLQSQWELSQVAPDACAHIRPIVRSRHAA